MRNIRVIGWTGVVVAAWALDATAAIRRIVPAEMHGLCDCGTASLTVVVALWLIIRHFAAPRLKAGQRVITDEEAERMEAAAWRAVEMADRRSGDGTPRGLRLASGDR